MINGCHKEVTNSTQTVFHTTVWGTGTFAYCEAFSTIINMNYLLYYWNLSFQAISYINTERTSTIRTLNLSSLSEAG